MPVMIGQGTALDWSLTPLEALERWPGDRRVLFLHSGRLQRQWARWSILGEPVATYRFLLTSAGGRSVWSSRSIPAPDLEDKPFADLRSLRSVGDGIWIGYLSYDLGRWVERLPNLAVDDRHWPIIEFGYCPGYLVYDGLEQCWYRCGAWRDGNGPALDSRFTQKTAFTASNLRSTFTRPQYERAVIKVKEYIAGGDVFQVNLAQRFTADLEPANPFVPRAIFDQLATVSPAWYGAYLELQAPPGQCRAIASTSPELFLQVDPGQLVTTRPIKGTRSADVDPQELLRSEKDCAELHMIVDLLRNDLGRVCDYGTIKVVQPRAIELHPTIHHGVSTITGRLHPSKDVVDLFRATIPGGSITGAPKVRAMQIIDELEPVRRGPYCGTIGVLTRSRAYFNIAIRTMLIDVPGQGSVGGRADFSVGGGIVADSDPGAEYDETLTKAQAMIRSLQNQTASMVYV